MTFNILRTLSKNYSFKQNDQELKKLECYSIEYRRTETKFTKTADRS